MHVELTRLQKAYYRAVFEKNRTFLTRGAGGGNVASVRPSPDPVNCPNFSTLPPCPPACSS